MPILTEITREILRGNLDFESFSPPNFYLNCKLRFARMSRDEIKTYQLRKVQNIINYALRYSAFFAKHYRDLDVNRVWSLPTVNKELMMENLSTYNTIGLTRQEILDFCLEIERSRDFSKRLKDVNIGMSSGTSGNKGVEITTRREEAYLKTALFARFPLPKAKLNLAFILRVSTPAFQINRFGHHLTYINQMNPLEEICAQLESLEPNVISAPTSMLRLLADQVEQGKLSVNLKEIVSYAEILYPEDKNYLSQVFNCPVFEIYKATEGAIALSCRLGNLHINEDLIAVELFDENGTPTQAGKPSHRMLVTDLHKTSQPILRYELDDVLTISPEPCLCGSSFRVIQQIQGRADDLFCGVRADGGQNQFIFPDYIRRAIIVLSDTIKDYQVIQTDLDAVSVHLLVSEKANMDELADLVKASIQKVFTAHGCCPPEVKVDFLPPIPNANSSKLIRIHRAFDRP